jgi:hypothetical protein
MRHVVAAFVAARTVAPYETYAPHPGHRADEAPPERPRWFRRKRRSASVTPSDVWQPTHAPG